MRRERERACKWCSRAIDGEGDYCSDDCAMAANLDQFELDEDRSHVSTVGPDYEDLHEEEPDGGDWECLLSDVEWQRERRYHVALED